jgi:hypothetical protein
MNLISFHLCKTQSSNKNVQLHEATAEAIVKTENTITIHPYHMCVHENIIIKCNKQFSLRLSPIHADIIHAIIISFHFIYIYCAHT